MRVPSGKPQSLESISGRRKFIKAGIFQNNWDFHLGNPRPPWPQMCAKVPLRHSRKDSRESHDCLKFALRRNPKHHTPFHCVKSTHTHTHTIVTTKICKSCPLTPLGTRRLHEIEKIYKFMPAIVYVYRYLHRPANSIYSNFVAVAPARPIGLAKSLALLAVRPFECELAARMRTYDPMQISYAPRSIALCFGPHLALSLSAALGPI